MLTDRKTSVTSKEEAHIPQTRWGRNLPIREEIDSLFNRGVKAKNQGKNRGMVGLKSGESRHSFGEKNELTEENDLWDDRKISSHNPSLYPLFHMGNKPEYFDELVTTDVGGLSL